MAQDASNNLTYYLKIDESKKEDLAAIRIWSNLKFGVEENFIWVKGFDYVQIHSLEVKSIPFSILYYEKNSKLNLVNSLLPERNLPNVLWTPIDRALPIKLTSFNNNYFGIREKIEITLIETTEEKESEVMITTTANLNLYIQSAPSIRLEKLQWSILNNDKVFLIGTPLLPITGDVYWKNKNHIIPTGYNFELPLVSNEINSILNLNNDYYIIWNKDNTYALLDLSDLEPLSISSFRLSLIKHPIHI